MCIIVCLNYIAKKKTTNNRVVVMGASLSTRGNKHRSNKNIDQPFKNGSQFHPTFDVHDVVSKNGGSTNETSQSIDDPAKFLLRASGVEIDDEKSVEDVHAEEVIKRHVVNDANFIGKPTTLNEDDMNAPLSHYFINSRYRNIFFLFLFIRLLSFFLSSPMMMMMMKSSLGCLASFSFRWSEAPNCQYLLTKKHFCPRVLSFFL